MKPALFYAVRKNLYNTVVAVTSEKPSRHGCTKWAGRDVKYTEVTHGTSDQIIGRFETQEQAEALRTKIGLLGQQYDQLRKPHQDAISRLHREEREALDRLCKGTTDDQ